ncbi:MAG: hypothetical protein MUC74_07300 [Ideonella sp.]|jgi:hypothetical protein|nr:hypothetical protein [Ideonella sp.]
MSQLPTTRPPPSRTPRAQLPERLAYTGVAVGASLAITAVFSVLLNGAVLPSFLLTGFACSLIVAWFMTGQVQRAQQAELTASLQDAQLRAHEERIESLRAVMREVNHHVNNLANNLQLVDLEYSRSGQLTPGTLEQLKAAITSTSDAMRALNRNAHEGDAAPSPPGDHVAARRDRAVP